MIEYSEYEKILRKNKRIEWYETLVPEKLITPSVKAMANQIVEQINKYEGGVDGSGKSNYILSLWENVRNLPYTMNGDFYLIKKREIEEKIKNEEKKKPKSKKERISKIQTEPKTKQTKNSNLIFGNKK